MKKYFLFLMIFTIGLCASNADRYINAIKLYQKKEYKKAFKTIQDEANKGNKEAQYLIANMYENGLGTKQDVKKALFWYKKSASKYNYITKQDKKHKLSNSNNFFSRLKDQLKYSSDQKGLNYAFAKVDTKSKAVKNTLLKMVEDNFGLKPYKTNFIAPFTISSTSYKRHFSAYPDDKLSDNIKEGINYKDHVETEFQLSFQKSLTYNLFGWNEYINFAYTQHVWWKIYDRSAPFRETNYIPELFMLLPTSDYIDAKYNLKGYRFGYRHQSNGQEGYRSRSWDRLFFETIWQRENLFVKAQVWYRIPEKRKDQSFYDGENPNAKGDDNPDILDYMGYGDITFKYLYNNSQLNLMLRKKAIQIDYSKPFFNSSNTFWYLKLFSGYGESIIDYNQNITKFSLGFAFSQSIF